MSIKSKTLKVRSYIRVRKAFTWLVTQSRQKPEDRFKDEYYYFLGAPKTHRLGPMVIAEGLLSLINAAEWNDKHPDVPIPTVDDLEFASLLDDLLKLMDNLGYDGRPYLYLDKENGHKVEFTDAVCFMGLAYHQSLQRLEKYPDSSDLKKDEIDRLTKATAKSYQDCIRWLLDNSIGHPLYKGRGWSWCGKAYRNKEGELIAPPQTYFTCSAIITLTEALCLHGPLVQNWIVEITEALDKAREFLIEVKVSGNNEPGWIDFIPICTDDGKFPHKCNEVTIQSMTGAPDLQKTNRNLHQTIYVLEAFGHLRNYLQNIVITSGASVDKCIHSLYKQVESDIAKHLDGLASNILSQFEVADELRYIRTMPSKMQMPKGVNFGQGNYYIDGSTLANIWNAFEVYFQYAENIDLKGKWSGSLRVGIIEELLNTSGSDSGFPSLVSMENMDSSKSYVALYATRSTASVLFDFGLTIPPQATGEAIEEIEKRLREARQAIDDAHDRLASIRGEDKGPLKKGGYMQAFKLAEALFEFTDLVFSFCHKKDYDIFKLPTNTAKEDVAYVINPENCKKALNTFREIVIKLAGAETADEFSSIIDTQYEKWDGSYFPAAAYDSFAKFKEKISGDQLVQHQQRFLLISRRISNLTEELKGR